MHHPIKSTGLFARSRKCHSIWTAGAVGECGPRTRTNYGISSNERSIPIERNALHQIGR